MLTLLLQLFTVASGRLRIELQSFNNDANELADGSQCDIFSGECDTRFYACHDSHGDCRGHDLSGNRDDVGSRNINSQDFRDANNVPFFVGYPVRSGHLVETVLHFIG